MRSGAGRWHEKRFVLLLHIFRGLLLVHETECTSAEPLTVRHFAALLSVFPHPDPSKRRYKMADGMSHPIASLLYMASCVGMVEMRRREVFPLEAKQGLALNDVTKTFLRNFTEDEVKVAFSCQKNTVVG